MELGWFPPRSDLDCWSGTSRVRTRALRAPDCARDGGRCADPEHDHRVLPAVRRSVAPWRIRIVDGTVGKLGADADLVARMRSRLSADRWRLRRPSERGRSRCEGLAAVFT